MRAERISDFTLERYRLGELETEDSEAVDRALAGDDSFRLRLEKLNESDRELRLQYPAEFFKLESTGSARRRWPQVRLDRTKRARLTGIAALVIAGILIPVLFVVFARNKPAIQGGTAIASAPPNLPSDRIKGTAHEGSGLSIYLKENQETPLANQTILKEGNTVQLAYTAPAGSEYYGVIFSVDGRSEVTMHYPYRIGQSSLLVPGRHTYLDEAYTLDDAPDFEVFIMVISTEPLDPQTVIRKADGLTVHGPAENEQTQFTAQHIEENSRTIFEDCGVETVTVLKKSTTPP